MCSHPNGETWASRSGAIWVPLAARVLTTSPSFMVFQNRPSRPEAAILVILENTSGTGWLLLTVAHARNDVPLR